MVDGRRRHRCVILNAFPRNLKTIWPTKPDAATFRHMRPWCRNWLVRSGHWILHWSAAESKHYYQYHVLLHEVGHINQPDSHSSKQRESFAEDFALIWARRLGQLDGLCPMT